MLRVGDKLKPKAGRFGIQYDHTTFIVSEVYFHDRIQSNVVIIINNNGDIVEHRAMSEVFVYWILIKHDPPKTELEWLDRVKENFKYD